MADISKIKLANGDTVNIKDTAARADIATAQGAIAAEVTRAKGEEARIEGLVTAEASRATTAEGGLDTRIKALESKGRFLSTWNAETGKPDTYPEESQLEEGKYNYRSGDYYIVNKVVATAANNLMPDGAYITKSGDTWTVPTTAFTGTTLNLGDQFQYDGTKWVHIASATTVAFANIQGDAEENSNLKGKLDAKVREIATGDANGQIKYRNTADGTYTNVDVKGLEDLAYADTASGKFTPEGTITVTSDAIKSGSVTLNAFTQTSTEASITAKAAYTPAGSVSKVAKAAGDVDVLTGGSISVTVKDAAAATAVTDLTYENYTPAGTIAAKATGGTSAVLATAAFEKDASGVAITGTVSKPNITVTAGTEKTFATGLTGGKVATFTEGEFTAASYEAGFLSAGEQASFTQGTKASLTAQSKSKFASKMPKATVGTGTDAETLMFVYVDSTDTELTANFSDAVTDRGTFTANGDDSFTANTLQTLDATKFHGGSKAADTFVANELQDVATDKVHDTPTAALAAAPEFTGDKFRVATTTDTVLKDVEFSGTAAAVKLTGAKYLKQEIDEASFSGTESGIKFTGTESANLIPTTIKYDKATANGANFEGTAAAVSATFAGTEKTVTVTPDAE